MTKRQNKKQALMASIISLVLCVSMLLGTTMAWFTDTVSNTGNRIMAGELGVSLWKYDGTDYVDISENDGKGDIFSTEEGALGGRLNGILWEPGKTEVVLLKVKNDGNLALNYNIILDVKNNSAVALEKALTYAIMPNVAGKDVEDANVAVYSGVTSWQDIRNMAEKTGIVPTGITTAAQNGALLQGESDYFALAVHMDEDAGNEYQNQEIEIDLKIEAKQMTYEYDSFGNQYDADALWADAGVESMEFPVVTTEMLNEGLAKAKEGGHPYLIANKDDFERVKNAINDPNGDSFLKEQWEVLAARAEEYYNAGWSGIDTTSGSYISAGFDAWERVATLAFVYRILGDEGLGAQCLYRAKKIALSLANKETWGTYQYIDNNQLAFAVALAYDWLYDGLTEEERQTLKGGLKKNHLDTVHELFTDREAEKFKSSFYKAYFDKFNHGMLDNSATFVAALAIADDEKDYDYASFIMKTNLDNMQSGFKNMYPDGGWPEGLSYWGYVGPFVARAFASMEASFGT